MTNYVFSDIIILEKLIVDAICHQQLKSTGRARCNSLAVVVPRYLLLSL